MDGLSGKFKGVYGKLLRGFILFSFVEVRVSIYILSILSVYGTKNWNKDIEQDLEAKGYDPETHVLCLWMWFIFIFYLTYRFSFILKLFIHSN